MEDKDLLRKIQLLKDVAPNENWVISCRSRLAFRMEMERKRGLLNRDIFTLKELFASWGDYSRSWTLKPVYALILVFGVVLGSGTLTVAAAMDSMPGSLLYPVKISLEKVRLLASTQNQLPQAQSDFTARRLEEFRAIVASQESDETKTQNMEKVVSHIQSQLITEKEQLPKKDAKTLAKAGERAEQVKKMIAEAKASLPTEVKSTLNEKLTEVATIAEKTTVQALEVMIKEAKTEEDKKELAAKFEQILKDKQAEIVKLADTGKEVIGNSVADKLPITSTVRAVLVNQSDEAKELLAKAEAALAKGDFSSALQALKALNEIINGAQKIADQAVISPDASQGSGSGSNASTSAPVQTPLK